MQVFVSCGGQGDNIGDSVLRRSLISNVRDGRQLHLLIGDEPNDFVEALGIRPDDQIYRDVGSWKRTMADACRNGPTVWFAKPGEMQTDLRSLKGRLAMMPLMLAVRRSGGLNIQTALGARNQPGLLAPLFRASMSLYELIYWRDPESCTAFGVGEIMPDWAFSKLDARNNPVELSAQSDERTQVVISLRGDRPFPGPAWIDGVREAARALGCQLRIVVQVRRDLQRSIELAEHLGAALDVWPDEVGHLEQEDRLRKCYRSARLVISDRLHVLIVAATEGATPLCIIDHSENKIGRHFDAIGYDQASICTSSCSAAQISEMVHAAANRSDQILRCMQRAGARLAEVREIIRGRLDGVEKREHGRLGASEASSVAAKAREN